jgi:hypothetical protein
MSRGVPARGRPASFDRRRQVLVVATGMGVLALSCAEVGADGPPGAGRSDAAAGDGASALPPCRPEGPAVVTDIDETLTVSDEEFVRQLTDGTYEPLARPGGPELFTAYAERGYVVVYVTARSEEMVLAGTGESARDATERWLETLGFPMARARVALAPTNAEVAGAPAQAYKTGVLRDLQAEGFAFTCAYGNALSDIQAYADAGIPKDSTFIIGPHAGTENTIGIEGDGFAQHAAERLLEVPAVCAP